jgi:hypothetical protein
MKANRMHVIAGLILALACAATNAAQPKPVHPPFDFDAAERIADQLLKRPAAPKEKKPAPVTIPAVAKLAASSCGNCRGTLTAICPVHKDQAACIVEGRTPEQNCRYCFGLGRLACPTCKSNKAAERDWAAVDAEIKQIIASEKATIDEINKDEKPDVLNVKLTGYVSPHFCISSTLDSRLILPCTHHGEGLIDKLETAFPAKDFTFTTHHDTRMYLLDTVPQYETFIQKIWKVRYPNADVPMALKASGVHTLGLPSIGTSCFERDGKSADKLQHSTVHYLGHFLIGRVAGVRQFPTWLEEGFAAYCETLELSAPTVYCMCYAENSINIVGDRNAAISKMLKNNSVVAMDKLAHVTYMSMKRDDYFQAWSLVTMLIARDPNKFVAFLKAMPKGTQDETGLIVKADEQEAALKQTYGYDYPKLIAVWKQWAATRR